MIMKLIKNFKKKDYELKFEHPILFKFKNFFKNIKYRLGLEKSFRTGYRLVMTCNYCGHSIYSRYSGEFVSCPCDSIYIDETPYYCRICGDKGTFTTEIKRIYNGSKKIK